MITKAFGVGGIGTGIFFQLQENRALSREESRLAVLTDFKDYCKGHIIMHYVSVLSTGVKVYMLGLVGQDAPGERLLSEMQSAGIDTRYIKTTAEAPTLFSVCFQYPDSAGGNITASNSACGLVTPEYIQQCAAEIDSDSLVLAAPEVPLKSRIRLLEIGRERGAFTVSSFASAEAADFKASGGFVLSDLLAVNMDEALTLSGGDHHDAANKITGTNPSIKLAITAGRGGVHLYEGGQYSHIPCLPAEVVSTAGAGDAFLGGTTAALMAGKDFIQAATFGTVTARFSVMSPNTIAETLTKETIETFLEERM